MLSNLQSEALNGEANDMSAYTVPLICEALSGHTVALTKNMYKHWHAIHLADYSTGAEPAELDMLIGSDQYWKIVTGEVRRGDSGPIAHYNRIGWVLSAPVEGSTHDSNPSMNFVSSTHVLRCAMEPSHSHQDDLIWELKRFWDLESLGIASSQKSIYGQFINNISFRQGR